MSETWLIDQYGCATNGKVFFNIRDVVTISRDSEFEVAITFIGQLLTFHYDTIESRDRIYENFVVAKRAHHEAAVAYSEQSRAISKAQLLIQGKMAQKITE